MKILVCDDNHMALYLFETLLRNHGYDVITASNGVEALALAQPGGLDLIISDILMPQMDGFQLCRKIKSNERLKEIPFIFCTAAYTDPKDEAFALSLGAIRYLVKPIEPDVFIHILQEVFNDIALQARVAPTPQVTEETAFLNEYNQRLTKKLEEKMFELEALNNQLRESEAKYRELIENAHDAVVLIQPTQTLSFVNPKFCELTGYTQETALHLRFDALLHPDDLLPYIAQTQRLLNHECPSIESAFRLVKKTGQFIDVEGRFNLLRRNETVTGIQAILRDITERKLAEQQLQASHEQLRRLAAHLQTVREEERASISYEIHDELGQLLTAIRLRLKGLERQLPPDPQVLSEELAATLELVNQTLQIARRIAMNLRPPILDDFGLWAALEWQIEEFQKYSGIQCLLEPLPLAIELAPDCAIGLFRICQESLTNVARHAQASQVSIDFTQQAQQLVMRIRDNGKGINPAELKQRRSLGLVGMRERALAFGGAFEIQGQQQQGTTVTITIPIANNVNLAP
ncbi:MAG: response regulator [Acidobacteria bacterium]|nr:response regulator [Acidobacteriota bacterium]MBI3427242.1 response regulator [Acidobacteriota bacterium]